MSRENLDLLRRGYEYVERTGEFLPEAVHPDFVWDTTTFQGGSVRRHASGSKKPTPGSRSGSTASKTGRSISRRSSTPEIRWSQLSASVGRVSTGGPEVNMRVGQVWTFRDGLLARMEIYADRDEALEAAGLEE
jgi:hypothetical protein